MRSRRSPFKGRQFTAEVILWAVRWYLQFPISTLDLERMLADRGVAVDHTTLFRWICAYVPELDKRLRPHLRMTTGSWRVDETYVKVKGRWMYLYRAVDARGQTIDFLLSAKRDTAAARRFFRKALKQAHTVNPRTVTVDKNAAYPSATKAMKKAGELWRFAKLRQVKYLNNIIEQDHRRIKRLVRPGSVSRASTPRAGRSPATRSWRWCARGRLPPCPPTTCPPKRPSSLICSVLLPDDAAAAALRVCRQTLQRNPCGVVGR